MGSSAPLSMEIVAQAFGKFELCKVVGFFKIILVEIFFQGFVSIQHQVNSSTVIQSCIELFLRELRLGGKLPNQHSIIA